MVRVRVVLGGFYYGSGNDYKYGLKNTFVWGVTQHIRATSTCQSTSSGTRQTSHRQERIR